MKQFKVKNIKLEGVIYDSGWIMTHDDQYKGRREWERRIKTDRTPESIIKELEDAGDHGGWTGVALWLGRSTEDTLCFGSVYDSGD